MISIVPIWKRGARTSRFVIILRMFAVCCILAMPWVAFCWWANGLWWTIQEFIGIFLFLFLPFQLAVGVFINVVAFLIYHNLPGYWERKATGHDEFFDNEWMPPFFNPDSWGLKLSGMVEPRYGFEIPEDWLLFCHTCGARNPLEATRCHYCHIEFDKCGQSSFKTPRI